MSDETAALIAHVRSLLDAPLDESVPGRASIEYTLTEGYARALALEAERRRLERRITELAGVLEGGDDDRRLDELAALARSRSRADGDLSRLRGVLGALRDRFSAAAAAI